LPRTTLVRHGRNQKDHHENTKKSRLTTEGTESTEGNTIENELPATEEEILAVLAPILSGNWRLATAIPALSGDP
jgi:hypothetical protein